MNGHKGPPEKKKKAVVFRGFGGISEADLKLKTSLNRVFFVCKKVHRGEAQFEVGEVNSRLPLGFYEVRQPPTRTLSRSRAISRARELQSRGGR